MAKVLWAIAVILAVLGLAAELVALGDPAEATADLALRFLVSAESTVPAWYSSVLLLLCSPLLLAAGQVIRAQAWRLRLLALTFLVLAVDEAAMLHELGNGAMNVLLALPSDSLRLLWIMPVSLLVLALAAVCLPLVRAVPRAILRLWMVAGLVFCGGAIGAEVLNLAVLELSGVGYAIAVTFEEGMETAGVVVFICSLLRLLAQGSPRIELRLTAQS